MIEDQCSELDLSSLKTTLTLKFRDKNYQIESNKNDFMPFMAHRGSARSCRSPITPVIKKSKTLNDFQNQSFNRELLDDQFKLNLENINQNDVVQLQIVLGSRNKN